MFWLADKRTLNQISKKYYTSFVLHLGDEWLLPFSYFALLEKMDRSHCLILMLEHWQIYFISIYPTSQSYNSCQVKDPALASSQTIVTSSSVSSYQFCQKHVCFVFCKCLREIFNKPNWPSIPNCKSIQHARIRQFMVTLDGITIYWFWSHLFSNWLSKKVKDLPL